MASTTTQNETQDKAPSAPVIVNQPETPEKEAGPGQVARIVESSAAPPPNGASSPTEGAEMSGGGMRAPGAGPRAQMMRSMQRSVGNARLGRMFARTAESPKEENKEPPKPPVNGNRIQTLAVSHPDDPSEKEAEAVAHRVVSGQSAGAAPVSQLASGATPTAARMAGDEKGSADDKKPVPSAPAQPEGKPAQAMGIAQRVETGDQAQVNAPVAADAIANKGAGSPISRSMRNSIEPHLGADLSGARVHHDNAADEAASAIKARAFTHGSDIFLARGESQNDTHLMAHEATHVAQQSAAPETASSLHRKATAPTTPKSGKGAGGKPAADLSPAPGVLELKGMKEFAPSGAIEAFLEEHKNKEVAVKTRFGTIAEGELKVSKVKDSYKVKRQPLTLNHPLFKQIEGETGGITLCLFVSVDNKNQIVGFIGISAKADSAADLGRAIKHAPDLIGLAGLQVPELKLTNTLRDGRLELGAENIGFNVGRILKGKVSLQVIDENIAKLAGTAEVAATGLAKGEVKLERNKDGLVTGQGHIDLDLKKGKFTGGVDVIWDGRAVTGEGKVGYSGEKLSGEVTLRLMEKGAAAQYEKEKKAPPEEAGKAPAATTTKDSGTPKNVDYVVFGEGDLTFAFNEWLNGTAHVIVDREGFVTIIGKITPQKEFELFKPRPFNADLFNLEARATYGVPLLADIFIFASVKLSAYANLGPAKFHDIVVEGTYSTNPAENKNFSIKGSINISAEAGLKLRAEAGAGLEVLGHDIKAGAGLTGTAGIKAYAEATPKIGYREKGAPGEDKKGEFYIRGDLEIAAQPFLGLSGDLFVELETPWWSPISDHRWTWPLFDKEYPLGGSMGVLASVDYVFGSGQWPSLELKPVEFDGAKFMSDLYDDKTQPKSGAPEEKKGDWKEKNEGAPEPPKPVEGKGNAKKGKLPEQPTPKPKVQPGGPKGPEKHVDDKAKLGDKSVEEHKKVAAEKGERGAVKDAKDTVKEPKGAEEKAPDKAKKQKEGPESTDSAERSLSMMGTPHKLILTAAASPKLEIESKRDLLSNKIGRAVGKIMKIDPGKRGQIEDLKWIGGLAKKVQGEAISFGKDPTKRLNEVPGYDGLKDAIEDYGKRWKVTDIEEFLTESTTPTLRDKIKALLDKAEHVPPANYSRGKHWKGNSEEERRASSEGGGAGQFMYSLTASDVKEREREAFLTGELEEKGAGGYWAYKKFSKQIGYAEGEEAFLLRAEMTNVTSGGIPSVHSHPRQSK